MTSLLGGETADTNTEIVDAMVRGISIARGRNPDVQNNVIIKDQADTYPVGTPRILFAQTEGGVAKNNTIWSSTTSGPTLIDTAAGVITPPTDTGNYAVNNADIPAAYASPVFGPDYTVAQLRAAFTSKVGGPLDTTPAKGIGVGTTYVDYRQPHDELPVLNQRHRSYNGLLDPFERRTR